MFITSNNLIAKYFFIFFLFSTFNCSGLKQVKLLKGGHVQNKDFVETISFDYIKHWIFIDVLVNGKKKKFMIDTGAPNIITPDLFEELNLNAKTSTNMGSSTKQTERVQSVIIDSIQIGDIVFYQMGASVIDLDRVVELRCLNIDGLIGANLLRQAKWQFDFKKKTITFSNKINALNLSSNAIVVPFKKSLQGTPIISLSFDGIVEHNCKLDTGNNGFLSMSSKKVFKGIEKRNWKTLVGYGIASAGVFGKQKDTLFNIKINDLMLGDAKAKNQIIKWKKNGSNLLGNQFLDHYKMTIDWKRKEVLLELVEPFESAKYEDHGFRTNYQDEEIFIGLIYNHPLVQAYGLKLDDQILNVNGRNFKAFKEKDYCEAFLNNSLFSNDRLLNMTIQRDSKTIELQIPKLELLGN